MKEKKNGFPTVTQVLGAVQDFVKNEHGDVWPEDEWFEHNGWDVNVWTDGENGEACVTLYPITPSGQTQTNLGVTFSVQAVPSMILGELRALGEIGALNDMNALLFSDLVSEIIKGAETPLKMLADQLKSDLDGIERDLDNLQGKSLLANDDGTYSLPETTAQVVIDAGIFNNQAMIVTIDRRVDGGIEVEVAHGDDSQLVGIGE